MAEENDYKKLLNKWLTRTHAVGSPDLDALIDIANATSLFSSPLYTVLHSISETNKEVLAELKLLNARFEEAAETHITKDDTRN